ncbi:F-box/LRR-repeat protein At3g26922-like [Triticum dicoccoides]|uniref:F-box/LRR-repeat protein At3g26922-like n=1 Tax=Triticum dicoccoides TaxID=85692 RepID=UPI00188E4F8B|nr:F-box/LRR-repeat protein At3g26922-like [Triticum dicoccoides]XP_037487183.1 F-box/LRR-repeat protein At3g26922-like [Triticum dicoccoides]
MASGEDRISALPEDILHQVLRLLPAHEVVRTCLLARRWRGVWRSVPTLCFTGAKGWGSADRFAQFVDHLLHLRCGGDGPPLDSCDFDFDHDGFMLWPANKRRASIWLWKALPRVRALGLCIVEELETWTRLSDKHLFSQQLTRLELAGVSVSDSVVDFSGCPALVQLSMDYCDVFVRQLVSPSLKHLRVTRCYTSRDYRILISLPNLVSLEFIQWGEGRAPLLGSLPQLARADIFLNGDCADQCSEGRFDGCDADDSDICYGCYYYYGDPIHGPHYDCNNCIVLKGLSEATDLELTAYHDPTVLNRDLKWCPTFTKLKTLLLNDWCLAADHNALICFLQHAPILEKLTIQLPEKPSYVTGAEGIYKPLGQSVASNCLEIVEIKCANVDSRVHKILKILTMYGIHLEQISVQQTCKIPGSGCFNFVCTGFC